MREGWDYQINIQGMRETREQLIERAADLKHDNERLTTADQIIRREFAKAFSWYETTPNFGYERKPLVPSWEQIFVEIGKLLAARTFYSLEGNVSELECAVEQIKRDLQTKPTNQ